MPDITITVAPAKLTKAAAVLGPILTDASVDIEGLGNAAIVKRWLRWTLAEAMYRADRKALGNSAGPYDEDVGT